MKYNDAMPKMKVDPERYVSATFHSHLRLRCCGICGQMRADECGIGCRGGRHVVHCRASGDATVGAGVFRVLVDSWMLLTLLMTSLRRFECEKAGSKPLTDEYDISTTLSSMTF
jgi:hypothetical protein